MLRRRDIVGVLDEYLDALDRDEAGAVEAHQSRAEHSAEAVTRGMRHDERRARPVLPARANGA